ncbi:MAG: hypothetical protein IH892_10745 [Planctomycetes bacterium]|nr:hypothetical protein [Planctomycetota bacterium]
MKHAVVLLAIVLGQSAASRIGQSAEPIEIGSRRELFVDRYLIEELSGGAALTLHKPQPQEVVLTTDKPWEGNTCAYYTIFRDGDRYRMYYRGSHYDEKSKKAAHPEVTCYAESTDGIHWSKPELGLFEFDGSKKNNIVWDGIGTHCFVAFKDENPDCPPAARYKGIARGRPRGKKGLYVFKSPDGIHWSLLRTEPVITDGAFDSQNLAFWDRHANVYREYHRTFVDGVRAIMTGTSTDFVNWSEPVLLKFPGAAKEHLYTNAVRVYERAPHLLIGFPTRYLPKQGSRVEPVFMSSRDGLSFHRWPDAVIPENAPEDRGGNRSNYMAWGLLQLPGNDRAYSVYATEAYYTGPDSRVRRFTYRVDGFVSAHAGEQAGDIVTKPITFYGKRLTVNFATSTGGKIQIELQDVNGKPLKQLSLNDCRPLQGDAVDQTVRWGKSADVGSWAGKPVRLHFRLTNADLYSFRFQD